MTYTNEIQPSQVAHPARAAFRTFVAVALPAIFGALVLLPTVAPVLVEWAAEHPDVVPAEVTAVIVAFATWVTAIATLITRLLAIPGVEAWMRKHAGFLAAEPS